MHPKSLRLLITGIAFAIFGPVLGWVLSIAGLFHTAQTAQERILQSNPFDFSGLNQNLTRTTSQVFLSFVPLLVGVVCGALGAFLILYALLKHFLAQPATPPPLPATVVHEFPPQSSEPQPQDDSRYLPKS